MREVNATEMKGQFGVFLDLSKDEPVGIRKSGKLTAVMQLLTARMKQAE